MQSRESRDIPIEIRMNDVPLTSGTSESKAFAKDDGDDDNSVNGAIQIGATKESSKADSATVSTKETVLPNGGEQVSRNPKTTGNENGDGVKLAKSVIENTEKDTHPAKRRRRIREDETEICQVCGDWSNAPKMLLCDMCDCGFHTYCLNPPLSEIPRGDWYCPYCVSSEPNFDESGNKPKKVAGRKAGSKSGHSRGASSSGGSSATVSMDKQQPGSRRTNPASDKEERVNDASPKMKKAKRKSEEDSVKDEERSLVKVERTAAPDVVDGKKIPAKKENRSDTTAPTTTKKRATTAEVSEKVDGAKKTTQEIVESKPTKQTQESEKSVMGMEEGNNRGGSSATLMHQLAVVAASQADTPVRMIPPPPPPKRPQQLSQAQREPFPTQSGPQPQPSAMVIPPFALPQPSQPPPPHPSGTYAFRPQFPPHMIATPQGYFYYTGPRSSAPHPQQPQVQRPGQSPSIHPPQPWAYVHPAAAYQMMLAQQQQQQQQPQQQPQPGKVTQPPSNDKVEEGVNK